MSGFFGVVSERPCISDLFYGTDYHSHLGTKRAGLATFDNGQAHQNIHNIQNSHFRPKFSKDLVEMTGNVGIGVISDTEAQPVMVNSHLGRFAICTVSKINNIDELEQDCLSRHQQFTDLSRGKTNPTELVALLISQGKDFVDGIENVYRRVKGSCNMLILTPEGIIAARDRYGRTPIVIGRRGNDYAVASESHSYVNMGYETCRFVGPGEVVNVTVEGGINIPLWQLSAHVAYNLLAGNIWYDNAGIVQQNAEAMSILSASLNKNFILGPVHLDHKVLVQLSSKPEVIPLPLVAANARYYIQFTIGPVKAMTMQLGVNAWYNTKWYLPAWNPALGVFHNQEEREYGNYPVGDLFVNMQWKRACVFVKWENAGMTLFDHNDYFSADRYIRTTRAVKFGLYWPFYTQPGKDTPSSKEGGNGGGSAKRPGR